MVLVLLFGVCAVVLAVSFLCSLTEAVLLSLNPLKLRVEETKGAGGATRWLTLKNRIERPIGAILVFNTIANTGLATFAGALFVSEFGAEWLWLFSVAMTAGILFGAEMAPKIIGVNHAERLAGRLLRPLEWMMFASHPMVLVMDWFSGKLKTGKTADPGRSTAIMDIITLVEAAKAEQVIHNREEIIIIHAATLSARRVVSTMVPADAVKLFDQRLDFVGNLRRVKDGDAKLHRSYPVSGDGSLAACTGYVRVRELFEDHVLEECGGAWVSRMRPVLTIPHRASLTQLLAAFLEHREIAAVVESDDGAAIGWITMDDVTETLMGAR